MDRRLAGAGPMTLWPIDLADDEVTGSVVATGQVDPIALLRDDFHRFGRRREQRVMAFGRGARLGGEAARPPDPDAHAIPTHNPQLRPERVSLIWPEDAG
jgi:hypothetical protein